MGFIKVGTGQVALGGINTYEGDTMIMAGELLLQDIGSISSSPSLILQTGSTFSIEGIVNSASINSLSGDGTILLGSHELVVNQLVEATFAGSVSGEGVFVKNGAATLFLSGENVHTGGTTAAEGTLALINHGTLLSLICINSGAVFDVSGISGTEVSLFFLSGGGQLLLGSKNLILHQDRESVFGGVISGAGSLTKLGARNSMD